MEKNTKEQVEFELEKLNPTERRVMFQFLMKLNEAFKVEGLEELAKSDNPACKAIYDAYVELKGMLD